MNSTNNESAINEPIKEQSSADEILNESINELKFADERYKDLNKEQSESLKKGWIKSDVKPERPTDLSPKGEPIKKEPKPRLEGEPERAVRKKRATNAIIREFVKWAFEIDAYNNYTTGRIKQLYFDKTGVDLTLSTISNQKKRWIVIDGEIYDKNKAYLMPKNIN